MSNQTLGQLLLYAHLLIGTGWGAAVVFARGRIVPIALASAALVIWLGVLYVLTVRISEDFRRDYQYEPSKWLSGGKP